MKTSQTSKMPYQAIANIILLSINNFNTVSAELFVVDLDVF